MTYVRWSTVLGGWALVFAFLAFRVWTREFATFRRLMQADHDRFSQPPPSPGQGSP
ncbi:MAG: hypothetical protein LC620_08930 [Halobacteriales archaeon]|nr:hypothetical protein [Halobacteriales archaeon]